MYMKPKSLDSSVVKKLESLVAVIRCNEAARYLIESSTDELRRIVSDRIEDYEEKSLNELESDLLCLIHDCMKRRESKLKTYIKALCYHEIRMNLARSQTEEADRLIRETCAEFGIQPATEEALKKAVVEELTRA